MVKKRLLEDSTLSSRTKFTADPFCTLVDFCLMTTYFQYSEGFHRQKHGCAMGSSVSPLVASLDMEEVENKAVITFTGTAPSYWFRYVEASPEHQNAVDNNIKLTLEDVRGDSQPVLDCAVHTEEGRSLNIEIYRKPTHTNQYLLFNSHHPLEHKLGVIRTLNHWAETGPTS